jgi:anti-sigma B factor antagonist
MELGRRRFAETVVLSPAGRIDHATTQGFKTALLTQLGAGPSASNQLVLDLGAVEYIASVGLRALMLAAREAKAQGRTLVVAALQPLVREVFEISRFTLLFTVFPSVRDALAALSPDALVAFDGTARA